MAKCEKCGKRLRRNYSHGTKQKSTYTKSCNCNKR